MNKYLTASIPTSVLVKISSASCVVFNSFQLYMVNKRILFPSPWSSEHSVIEWHVLRLSDWCIRSFCSMSKKLKFVEAKKKKKKCTDLHN